MNIVWPFHRKQAKIALPIIAEDIDQNLDRLFQDIALQAAAIAAKQIDVSGSDDVTGIMPPTRLGGAATPDLTKFYREDGTFAVPPIDGGDASGIRTFFSTHISNVWTDMGCTTANHAGTHAAQLDAGGMFERWTTAAAANSQAGWRMTGSQVWANHDPDYIYRIRTGGDITNTRIWLGGYNAIPTGAIDTPTARSVGVRFSTVAGDTSWVGFYVDSGGTLFTTSAIGSIAASTIYDVRIKVINNGLGVEFTINGATASLTCVNLTGVALTTIFLMGTGAAASARSTDFQRCHMETN